MIESFLSHLSNIFFISKRDKVLLAVSGGADSMVMLDLFIKSDIPIGVAHINHKLRNQDSEKDEELVREFCVKNNLPFHLYTVEKGILDEGNLQEKARNIRYAFLESTADTYMYTKIATAHHQDDNIETMLIHMMRGTGLEGLKGIPENSGKTIRPMLIFDHSAIRNYALEHHVPFREDMSNTSDKYLRNRIRLHILPQIYQSDLRARQGLVTTLKNMGSQNSLYREMIQKLKRNIVEKVHMLIVVDLAPVIEFHNSTLLLFEILFPYGFNLYHATEILEKYQKTGLRYYSEKYLAILDRKQLWIGPHPESFKEEEHTVSRSELPQKITLGWYQYLLDIKKIEDIRSFKEQSLYLDCEKLPTTFTLRTKRPADRIIPLGLPGRTKKMKDYMSDKKIPIIMRDNIPVIVNENNVYAVIPWGISDEVKLGNQTRFVIEVSEL